MSSLIEKLFYNSLYNVSVCPCGFVLANIYEGGGGIRYVYLGLIFLAKNTFCSLFFVERYQKLKHAYTVFRSSVLGKNINMGRGKYQGCGEEYNGKKGEGIFFESYILHRSQMFVALNITKNIFTFLTSLAPAKETVLSCPVLSWYENISIITQRIASSLG